MQIGTGPFMTEALLRSEASVDFLHCLIGFFDLKRRTKTRPTIPTNRTTTTTYIYSYRLSTFLLLIIIVRSFRAFSGETTWDGSVSAG
jgi:hypothetical protein